MRMLPLYLHVNQKYDDDGDDEEEDSLYTFSVILLTRFNSDFFFEGA